MYASFPSEWLIIYHSLLHVRGWCWVGAELSYTMLHVAPFNIQGNVFLSELTLWKTTKLLNNFAFVLRGPVFSYNFVILKMSFWDPWRSLRSIQGVPEVKTMFFIIQRCHLTFELPLSHECMVELSRGCTHRVSQQIGCRNTYENPAVFY